MAEDQLFAAAAAWFSYATRVAESGSSQVVSTDVACV